MRPVPRQQRVVAAASAIGALTDGRAFPPSIAQRQMSATTDVRGITQYPPVPDGHEELTQETACPVAAVEDEAGQTGGDDLVSGCRSSRAGGSPTWSRRNTRRTPPGENQGERRERPRNTRRADSAARRANVTSGAWASGRSSGNSTWPLRAAARPAKPLPPQAAQRLRDRIRNGKRS